MREYNAFNSSLTEQREVTPAAARMFQTSRPTSASVDDGLTMVMDPVSQADLRTGLPSGPFPAAMVSLRPVRGGITTPKRAALVGVALLAAALLVYIGRGYMHRPAEIVEPTELIEPTELTAPADAEDTIAVIPLTAALPSQPTDATPLAVSVAPVVVVLAPISDAAIPVPNANSPLTDQPVAELNGGPASSTDSSTTASLTEPSEPTEEIAAQPGSDAAIEPEANLPTPDTGSDEAQATADESPTTPAVATDRVADQSESAAGSNQATTKPTTVADQTNSAAQQDGTTATTASSATQVDLPRPANEQRGRGDADNHATGEGFKRASQVLSKLSQPISNAGQGGGNFGHR